METNDGDAFLPVCSVLSNEPCGKAEEVRQQRDFGRTINMA